MAKKERKLERLSADQIGRLPHWAQVAFAARCASRCRRVQEDRLQRYTANAGSKEY